MSAAAATSTPSYIAENGGKVVAEEYVPFGAPKQFEEIVTRIKSVKPDMVLITLVGADNVNFNRTFAGFGLDKDIARLSLLLGVIVRRRHRRRCAFTTLSPRTA